ncbi:MAG: hypothetical protein V1729_01205 [Candidatus Woesearchaeota archaeon]
MKHLLIMLILLLAVGCSSAPDMMDNEQLAKSEKVDPAIIAPGLDPCDDVDCDDGNRCTKNYCTPYGICVAEQIEDCQPAEPIKECIEGSEDCEGVVYPPLNACDALCNDRVLCDESPCEFTVECAAQRKAGCREGEPVTKCNDVVCNDGNACTEDYCGMNGTCATRPIFNCVLDVSAEHPCAGKICDDGDSCTMDYCDPDGECQVMPNPMCDSLPPVALDCDTAVCDDRDNCTTDYCEKGACVYAPIFGCNDIFPIVPTCDEDDSCTKPPSGDPCKNVICEDGDPCTIDECDANGVCVQELIPDCGQ